MTSALLGNQVLNFFNVRLDDFRIAGGLLALMIAFEMFQAQYGRFIHSYKWLTKRPVTKGIFTA